MSVTITFKTIAEEVPHHGQPIIFLRPTHSFGYQGFDPTEVEVEYQWTELDKDGDETGNATCYTEGDELHWADRYSHRLDIILDGDIADPDWLWIDVDDYWKCFDSDEDKDED